MVERVFGKEYVLAANLTTGNGGWVKFAGARGTLCVRGELDGASVQIQASLDQVDIMSTETGGLFTAAAARNFELCPCFLRVTTTGGGVGQDITVSVVTY